ncbi:MAG TPA: DNA primase [Candidatus Paceibacterota bacterium]
MPSALAQRVKERVSILEVVGERIELKRAGASWKARCPFHREKTPSFIVSPDRGTFCCFGCGAKGDAISFVQQFDGLSFIEALRRLAEKAGVPWDENEFRRGAGDGEAARSRRERLLGCIEAAADAYRRAFLSSELARKYAADRGLTDETVDRFRVGFAPNEWRYATEACRAKGFSDEEIEAAGIGKKGDDGKSFYDRFRGRLIFPILDGDGKPIAFAGRILPEFEKGDEGKYINSPETELFKKSRTLYGLPWARGAARRLRFAILVEGQFDLILCHQAGYENAVASSGTALTPEHLAEVAKWTENLVIAYDGDGAGLKAAERAIEMGLGRGMHVKVAALPAGKDPADVIRESSEDWKKLVRGARHVIDHLIAAASFEAKSTRDAVVRAAKAAAPLIAALESPIERAHFVKRLAEATGAPEEAAWEEVRRAGAKAAAAPKFSPAPAAGEAPGAAEGAAAEAAIADPAVRAAALLLSARSQAAPIVDSTKLEAYLKEILGGEAFTVAVSAAEAAGETALFAVEKAFSGGEPRKEITDFLRRLTHRALKDRLAESRRRITVSATETAIREHERLIREEKRLGARDEAPEPDVFTDPRSSSPLPAPS